MSKSKEDTSTSVDPEVEGMVKHPLGPKPSAKGDKLVRHLEKEAAARRDGKGR